MNKQQLQREGSVHCAEERKQNQTNKQEQETENRQPTNNNKTERTNRQRTVSKQIVNIVRRENERERVLQGGGVGGEHATLAERRHVQGAQSTQAAADGGAPKATPRFASKGRSGEQWK